MARLNVYGGGVCPCLRHSHRVERRNCSDPYRAVSWFYGIRQADRQRAQGNQQQRRNEFDHETSVHVDRQKTSVLWHRFDHVFTPVLGAGARDTSTEWSSLSVRLRTLIKQSIPLYRTYYWGVSSLVKVRSHTRDQNAPRELAGHGTGGLKED